MADKYILDENGDPIPCEDLIEWSRWIEKNPDKRRIEQTDIGVPAWLYYLRRLLQIKRREPCFVSTIFLGLNHNYEPDGPPLLFETMIFGGKHDNYCQRYSTKKDALIGHKKAVKLAR